MSSTNSTPTKASIEQIFTDVNQKLEDIISQYRSILMSNNNDPMHERLFAFCSELEALKKKIGNKNETLSIRTESVGDISQYMEDLISDVADYKKEAEAKTASNEIMSIITSIETIIGMIEPESTVIENDILQTPQNKNEGYFKIKQAALEKIIADHPEL